jgi:hypothetical protein
MTLLIIHSALYNVLKEKRIDLSIIWKQNSDTRGGANVKKMGVPFQRSRSG